MANDWKIGETDLFLSDGFKEGHNFTAFSKDASEKILNLLNVKNDFDDSIKEQIIENLNRYTIAFLNSYHHEQERNNVLSVKELKSFYTKSSSRVTILLTDVTQLL